MRDGSGYYVSLTSPSVTDLLGEFGNTAAGRDAARRKLETILRALFNERVDEILRHSNCSGQNPSGPIRHAGEPLGCPFPDACLCECHDSEVAP